MRSSDRPAALRRTTDGNVISSAPSTTRTAATQSRNVVNKRRSARRAPTSKGKNVLKRNLITVSTVVALLGTVALATLAQAQSTGRATWWPKLDTKAGAQKVDEWYSDVPWHQKLGTFSGNEILVPLVMPYEAMPADMTGANGYCTVNRLSQEDCMVEAGVLNVLGYHRVDTLYDDPKLGSTCRDQACIEVRLEISNYQMFKSGTGIALQKQVIGAAQKAPVYGGFYITDGSTYAPQMLWEMSHYCDSKWAVGDMQDPVCYADYFSPMNDGFHVLPETRADQWPASVPWSVWPTGVAPEPGNQCKPGEKQCVMVLAAYGMAQVPKDSANLQYKRYNDLLMTWFSNALVAFPAELGTAEIQNHFPWNGQPVTWDSFIYPRAKLNPFLGSYATTAKQTAPAVQPGCDTWLDGGHIGEGTPPNTACTDAPHFQAAGYTYPRACTPDDLLQAMNGIEGKADRLRACGVNFEIHPNGWLSQWPESFRSAVGPNTPFNYDQNEYGRTSFLFGGIPGMQMPVSFYKTPGTTSSIYEQVHNASIFSLYLPIANVADATRAMHDRNYTDTAFYHTLLMSNHMESIPEQFADGIRGKVLWHNEYRMEPMYAQRQNYAWLKDRIFQASFNPLMLKSGKKPAPFHNNTCDSCHVRNGSGVPINTAGKLDKLQTKEGAYMKDQVYVPYANGHESEKDYTFTGVIRPMKLVFFDLQQGPSRPRTSKYSEPLNATETALAAAPRNVVTDELYYNNKIMNYYGDSFHVSPKEGATDFTYTWSYVNADASRLVVNASRKDPELGKDYVPQQIKLGTFTTPQDCQLALFAGVSKPWPLTCADIADAAIQKAVTHDITTSPPTKPTVGYMHLNGKRLGNLGVIEAIPDDKIVDWQTAQRGKLSAAAGEIVWAPGTRDGVGGPYSKVKKDCKTNSLQDCFIGRFGWLGDRGSLEDQVANAAFVEMNITSKEGYRKLYGSGKVANPLRYPYPNCGPANKACMDSSGNSDLSERDIDRMADYGRWLGNPTRSEVQVSQPDVVAGEGIFKRLQCDTCHVIQRIDIPNPDKTVLSKNFRDRLLKSAVRPFLSYIGTDLLMHDMGYLSQVGDAEDSIRDPATGLVKAGYETYVQKIRTPPLKGLRFNNYVTDAHRNTKNPGIPGRSMPIDPGCDFLLHDGRACTAIEAAFLHDGPAIKQLQVIENLGKLLPSEVTQLRAFLYSL